MISRLLLVGMVGVLGISLPEGADLGMGMTWARTGATACACQRETVTFEPIAVDDVATNRIADELNRQSDGMNLPTAAIATVVRPVGVSPVDLADRLFAENDVWAGPIAEKVASDPVGQLFADNQVWAGPVGADPADRLFAENDVWAGPATEAVAATIIPPAPKPQVTFEPIEVAEGGPSVADELNRASEGLAIARDPEPTVGTALQLTRDAALAWLNVLTKTMPDAAR